jgi:hypothetical protein
MHFVQDSLAYSAHQSFVGVNAVISESEVNSRGGNVYYPVLPFEYLFTDETKPQVTVTIDGMPALCASLSCDYTYEPVGAEITAMTVAGTSVVITGTSLTSTINSVTIAGMACAISTNDGTTLSCTLPYNLYAGSHKPVVKDDKGLIPTSAGFAATDVPLVIDAVFPVTEVNTAGGGEITVQGSSFPSIIGLEDVSLTFSDGQTCDISETTETEMKCIRSFNKGRTAEPLGATNNLVLQFGSLAPVLKGVSFMAEPMKILSITPPSVSPILVKSLVIKLDTTGTSYTTTMMETDSFTVFMIPTDTTLKTRQLNVVNVDSANSEITVKYGGAQSNVYTLQVVSADHGAFVTSGVTLEAKIEVLDFNPKSGSYIGGSLVTITGGHFSDIATDNPVKFGYTWVGGVNHYCYVQETSDSEIKCRMATDYTRQPGNAEVIVFAATYEEAAWPLGQSRDFAFLTSANIPTVTDLTVDFQADNTYRLLITGTDITDTTVDTVDVYVGGIKQEVISVTPTSLEVQIMELNAGAAAQDIEIYFQEGVPNGMNVAPFLNGVSFDPKLVDLSTSVGSEGGSTIYAVIEGRGINDSVTLTNAAGVDLCASSNMVEYSLLECTLAAGVVPSGQLKAKDTGSPSAAGVVATAISNTYGSSTSPSVLTSITSSRDQIDFTGVNLNAFGTEC